MGNQGQLLSFLNLISTLKNKGTLLRNVALILIVYMYAGVMYILLRNSIDNLNLYQLGVIGGFNILFFLFFISFIRSAVTDPGVVPLNWGFYMGDDTKRRRYCKICNVWKPDRTHHCSSCNRCVLNMDHHCPWIGNCVGFYNRKYFMQLLVYSIFTLGFTLLQSVLYLYNETIENSNDEFDEVGTKAISYIYVCGMIFIGLALIIALIPFVQFHFKLVLRNSTTIENLDDSNKDSGMYDMGVGANLQQVFGANPLCWFAPCNLPLNRPVGDGVRWSQYCYNPIPDKV
uniref:Palmitoyltransferase n=1 Tax=Theileria annulata TaxID=5874 RepID=A0A3B0NFC3_THEAN